MVTNILRKWMGCLEKAAVRYETTTRFAFDQHSPVLESQVGKGTWRPSSLTTPLSEFPG